MNDFTSEVDVLLDDLLRAVGGRTETFVREQQAARAVTGLVGEAAALGLHITVDGALRGRPSRDVLYSRSGDGHGVHPAVLDRRGR